MSLYSSDQDFAVVLLRCSNATERCQLKARALNGHNNKAMQLDQIHRAMGWNAATVNDWYD
jgi:hypothetical protein